MCMDIYDPYLVSDYRYLSSKSRDLELESNWFHQTDFNRETDIRTESIYNYRVDYRANIDTSNTQTNINTKCLLLNPSLS